jgi:SAM-dependent methyltransferase
MFNINAKGYWESNSDYAHVYDGYLSGALINYLKDSNVKSVYDFGCGMGDYAKDMINNGILCKAFDGNPFTKELTGGIGEVLDLSIPVQLEKFDCVLSFEVGEHIPTEYESIFINNLINNTKSKIILSWAVEGQGGTGHVNCRNNDYIIDIFKSKGFKYDKQASMYLRNYISNAPWFKNTIMVFDKIK